MLLEAPLWQRGDFLALQRALPQGARIECEEIQYSVEDSDDTLKLRRHVERMVDEGTLSKAAKALVSNGIWPRTNDVLLELGRLHPQRNLPIPVDITPQQTIFASEEVLQAAL